MDSNTKNWVLKAVTLGVIILISFIAGAYTVGAIFTQTQINSIDASIAVLDCSVSRIAKTEEELVVTMACDTLNPNGDGTYTVIRPDINITFSKDEWVQLRQAGYTLSEAKLITKSVLLNRGKGYRDSQREFIENLQTEELPNWNEIDSTDITISDEELN